ncbi:MAG: GntR family transcriptional regulator [Blautia sp.]|nr:GntR family transcriptional regulator [Blautia sp.]MDY5030526.1 GntR family transcriptional regulator [Blautia sp.]
MKLVTEALNTKVYDELKKSIVEGEFPPEMQLVEAKISEMYGISRTPLREALQRLCQEGLICRCGKSYAVRRYTEEDLLEICELQKMLNMFAVRKVIREMSGKASDAEAMIDEIYHPEEKNSFVSTDTFHTCIAQLVGNQQFLRIYQMFRDQMRAFRAGVPENPEHEEKAQAYYREIYQAIKNRDEKQSEEIMERHARLYIEDIRSDLAKAEASC